VTAATERKLRLREQRRATRLAGARRLPLCALALLFIFAAQVFAQTKPALPTEEKTIESLLTNAGTLSIVQLGEDTDLKMELRLKGKRVYAIEGNMTAGFVAQFRTFSSGEIIVMTVGEGGTACPAQFQIVHIEDTGKVSVTDEFGDCGDSPTISLQLIPDEQVTLRFQGYYRLSEESEPGFKKPPPSTWVYKAGVLRQLNAAPPTKRRGK
jgi:hypothetical protein